MIALACLLLLSDPAADVPGGVPAVVTTLDGTATEGTITAIDAEAVRIDDQAQPLGEVQTVDIVDVVPERLDDAGCVVQLADGTIWVAADATRTTRETTITLPGNESGAAGETVTAPSESVRSIRLAILDEATADGWADLLDGDRRDDLLVVRKGDRLDFVACVVGEITAETIAVRVGGRDRTLPRTKAFGVIFPARSARTKAAAVVALTDGSRVPASAVTFDGAAFTIATATGQRLTRAADAVAAVDLAGGRMVRLASLTPRVQYEQKDRIFDGQRALRVGQNVLGMPPYVGARTDPQAIWMHSGTRARFPLPRGSVRLQATAGIDEIDGADIPARPIAVSVLGDGESLWSQTLQPREPVTLDVPLDGVRQLTIEVEGFTPDGIREHLVLLGARIVTE